MPIYIYIDLFVYKVQSFIIYNLSVMKLPKKKNKKIVNFIYVLKHHLIVEMLIFFFGYMFF